MNLTKESLLKLHDIEIRKDSKHYIVEDLATQEFYEMPKVCVDALNLIKQGLNLGEIEERLIKTFPDEEINLLDFGDQLIELNLIQSVNGEEIERSHDKNKLGFEWISPKFGKIFFNKYTSYLYGLIFLANIGIFCLQPSLFPHYTDLFVFDIMSLNVLVIGIISLILVLIHESGHIIAIRSFGLPTRLDIGHRLYLIVFETDLSLAWKLSPEKRNILYLAGVCFDTVILFFALILQMFLPIQSSFLTGLLGLVVFDVIVRIIYQACIYMKTDFYFLFENMTGTYNLMENGIFFLKGLFSRSKVKNKELFHGEERIVTVYSFFYVIGVGITIGLFFIYYLPQLIYMATKMLPGYLEPITDPIFWDAILFTAQILVIVGFLTFSFYKSYYKKNVEN
ncbi:hypothetical protein V7138_23420 [Bacillus sp. JJ1533]|uniref:hypothetical protein n=1 Tax=Bacillus sp. JJ1533 TaxID=3122959 RepID=UPI002FFDB95C